MKNKIVKKEDRLVEGATECGSEGFRQHIGVWRRNISISIQTAWVIGLAATVLFVASDRATAAPTSTNYWTGGGADNKWSTVANWSNGVPDTAAEIAFFGNDCADAAQTVDLDQNTTIWALMMGGTNNRAYTLESSNNSTLTLASTFYTINDAGPPTYFQPYYGDQPLTIDVDLEMQSSVQNYIYLHDSNAHIIVKGDITMVNGGMFRWTTSAAINGEDEGGGILELHGVLTGASGGTSPTSFNLQDVILGNEAAIIKYSPYGLNSSRSTTGPWGRQIHTLLTNLNLGYINKPLRHIEIAFRSDGDQDRRVETWNANRGGFGINDHPKVVFEPARNGGSGEIVFEIRYGGPNVNSVPFDFENQSGARIEFTADNGADSIISSVKRTHSAGITNYWGCWIQGAGSVVKTNNSTLVIQTASNTWSGGTIVYEGDVRLETNPVYAAHGPGQLPDTGRIVLHSGCSLDLNDIDDTVGGVGGDGTIDLGTATLTVSEGLTPGTSIGSLAVTGTGTLALSGTNTFELTDLATHDEVIFSGAASLVLGGKLKIETAPTFTAFGEYKLFDLDTGTTSGGFSEVIPPTLQAPTQVNAVVFTNDQNDVILHITKQPLGTIIIIK